jgi:hypothetical protein
MFCRIPAEVAEWTEFPTQATSHNHLTSRRFPPGNVCFNSRLVLSNEESVILALDFNVFDVLNCVLSVGRIGMHPEARIIGRPDRIYYLPPRDVYVLIEIKTNRALACDDLVTKYREDMDLIDRNEAPENPTWRQVQQIFGYLSHNRLIYGVLTTYHQTWFMRRDAGVMMWN